MISDNRDKLAETLQEASLHKLSADYCRDHSTLTIIEDNRFVTLMLTFNQINLASTTRTNTLIKLGDIGASFAPQMQ